MKKGDLVKVDFDYLFRVIKENGITVGEVCKLIGKSGSYLSYYKATWGAIPKSDIEKLQDLMEIDVDELCGKKKAEKDVITALIAEIGELRGKIAELEKRVDNPVPVSIPMNAKDMATKVMGTLLDSGWVSKDTVLVEFNKHHIPVEYISDALRANHAISATSGVANSARTFYIKESEVGTA